MTEFDYKELFAGEILRFNKFDMEFAIKTNRDLSERVINRLNQYNNSFHIVKALIRVYWGQISYLIDNPKLLVDFIRERNPQLFEVEGAEKYLMEQIQKTGYAIVDYIQPSAKVQVKLDKKAIKYKEKKDKKD